MACGQCDTVIHTRALADGNGLGQTPDDRPVTLLDPLCRPPKEQPSGRKKIEMCTGGHGRVQARFPRNLTCTDTVLL